MSSNYTSEHFLSHFGLIEPHYNELFHTYKNIHEGVHMNSILLHEIRHYLQTNSKFNCPYCDSKFHIRYIFTNRPVNLACHKLRRKENVETYNKKLTKYKALVKKEVYNFIKGEIIDDFYDKFKCYY